MSALRITAEPGRLYLMKDGERRRVESVTAHTVTTRRLHADGDFTVLRFAFEREIESVIE